MYGLRREDVTGLKGAPLPELERPKARERQAAQDFGRNSRSPDRELRGDTREVVGSAIGMSGKTWKGQAVTTCGRCGRSFLSSSLWRLHETGEMICRRCLNAAEAERARIKVSGH